MPVIFSYLNYRQYLKDFYHEKKQANPQFSYRVFSRLTGYSSPNFIKLVILGERNLTKDGIARLIKALKLKKRESKFFETLVQFNQAPAREEKIKHYEVLRQFKAFKDIKKLDEGFFQYLSDWHHAAIRDMTLLKNFREDPNWIVKKLKKRVSEKQVKDSIALMLKLGLLKRDKSKRLQTTDRNIATSQEVADISIANFHDHMIALAAESIDNSDPAIRDISSVTVALNQKTFEEAKRRMQEFRRELNVLLSTCKEPDAVYQLNFQIFNLTEVPWEK
jgi:uncharacterized protein (TIGR02147 family)